MQTIHTAPSTPPIPSCTTCPSGSSPSSVGKDGKGLPPPHPPRVSHTSSLEFDPQTLLHPSRQKAQLQGLQGSQGSKGQPTHAKDKQPQTNPMMARATEKMARLAASASAFPSGGAPSSVSPLSGTPVSGGSLAAGSSSGPAGPVSAAPKQKWPSDISSEQLRATTAKATETIQQLKQGFMNRMPEVFDSMRERVKATKAESSKNSGSSAEIKKENQKQDHKSTRAPLLQLLERSANRQSPENETNRLNDIKASVEESHKTMTSGLEELKRSRVLADQKMKEASDTGVENMKKVNDLAKKATDLRDVFHKLIGNAAAGRDVSYQIRDQLELIHNVSTDTNLFSNRVQKNPLRGCLNDYSSKWFEDSNGQQSMLDSKSYIAREDGWKTQPTKPNATRKPSMLEWKDLCTLPINPDVQDAKDAKDSKQDVQDAKNCIYTIGTVYQAERRCKTVAVAKYSYEPRFGTFELDPVFNQGEIKIDALEYAVSEGCQIILYDVKSREDKGSDPTMAVETTPKGTVETTTTTPKGTEDKESSGRQILMLLCSTETKEKVPYMTLVALDPVTGQVLKDCFPSHIFNPYTQQKASGVLGLLSDVNMYAGSVPVRMILHPQTKEILILCHAQRLYQNSSTRLQSFIIKIGSNRRIESFNVDATSPQQLWVGWQHPAFHQCNWIATDIIWAGQEDEDENEDKIFAVAGFMNDSHHSHHSHHSFVFYYNCNGQPFIDRPHQPQPQPQPQGHGQAQGQHTPDGKNDTPKSTSSVTSSPLFQPHGFTVQSLGSKSSTVSSTASSTDIVMIRDSDVSELQLSMDGKDVKDEKDIKDSVVTSTVAEKAAEAIGNKATQNEADRNNKPQTAQNTRKSLKSIILQTVTNPQKTASELDKQESDTAQSITSVTKLVEYDQKIRQTHEQKFQSLYESREFMRKNDKTRPNHLRPKSLRERIALEPAAESMAPTVGPYAMKDGNGMYFFTHGAKECMWIPQRLLWLQDNKQENTRTPKTLCIVGTVFENETSCGFITGHTLATNQWLSVQEFTFDDKSESNIIHSVECNEANGANQIVIVGHGLKVATDADTAQAGIVKVSFKVATDADTAQAGIVKVKLSQTNDESTNMTIMSLTSFTIKLNGDFFQTLSSVKYHSQLHRFISVGSFQTSKGTQDRQGVIVLTQF